ncbi:hypothetical protein PF005_g14340 [Phytophthora fragariae]|uniref:Uncharacterized protein n=1 Tax=Phytophthora fragariae TaxID=53985 RepID=A0A6A3EP63_9STRA|nr:hypothetical protein PF003_g13115 [Phytophthora fragariae]KAE8934323.1 hypothetical protein PF009_g15695 [Phytophthora fragariae]KAE9102722.1 hypothetical protein PF007_g14656 [Phytophthora fragariae]KAE9117326.1 hypothetical protein PF010_g8649 [Phytophthora fragariae]KAE9140196.1 hypothetical protein PF006_g13586 [Phytophthora fragariae]
MTATKRELWCERTNKATAEGAAVNSDALNDNESLQQLGHPSNKLGDTGAKAVAQVLPYNISIKYLLNIGIGEEGSWLCERLIC